MESLGIAALGDILRGEMVLFIGRIPLNMAVITQASTDILVVT